MKAPQKVSLSILSYLCSTHARDLGTYEEINGIRTYVATPKTDYPKDKAVLYLTDVFGHELLNNRARYPFHPLSLFNLLISAISSSPTTLPAMDSKSMSQSSSRVIPSPEVLSTPCVRVIPCRPHSHARSVRTLGVKFRSHEMAPKSHP